VKDPLFTWIGETIRKYRKARGLTQEQLAEAASLSSYFIGSMERGQATVSVRSLAEIARALRVPLAELFEFSDERGRDQLLREIEACARGASMEELHALLMVCRVLHHPQSKAKA
jgi:transcriptional regulator with XRE-family HTH domain